MRSQPVSWIALILLFAVSSVAQANSAADQLITLLKNVESLSARYEQSGQNTVQYGEFWLTKPDRFRLIAAAPVSQVIVSDGESLWTHDLDLEQVIISRLSDEADSIPLLLFTRNPQHLRDRYHIEQFEDETQQHFVLTPVSKDGQIGKVALSFENDLPLRLAFETAMQERTVISFQEVSSTAIDDKVFVFQVPEYVDVIDDRPTTD